MTDDIIVARAHREGRYWVFEIPAFSSTGPTGAAIVAMGQSRSLKDLEEDARDVAALWLDLKSYEGPLDVTIDLPDDVARLLSDAERAEAEGRAAIARSAQLRRDAAQTLTIGHKLTQAEAARALRVTPQRMSQLIADRRRAGSSSS